jgi:Tfp pilus assembly protein PilP
MTRREVLPLAVLIVLFASATLAGAAAPGGQAATPVLPSPALQPDGYAYKAEGRRDPFVSLLRHGLDPERSAASNRAPGLDGLGVGEVTLKGTMASRDGFVAILLGVDSRTYIARAGDKLLDGAIKTIAADGIVVVQRINDPLSSKKQREIRKALRQTEEAR